MVNSFLSSSNGKSMLPSSLSCSMTPAQRTVTCVGKIPRILTSAIPQLVTFLETLSSPISSATACDAHTAVRRTTSCHIASLGAHGCSMVCWRFFVSHRRVGACPSPKSAREQNSNPPRHTKNPIAPSSRSHAIFEQL